LEHKRRQLINKAGKHFTVKPIEDAAAFKEQGFLAYSSFYRRTGYSYKSDRKSRADYARWVDAVLQFPKVLVLGGYDPAGGLRAVSISSWVGHSLNCTSFFCDTPALEMGMGESILHSLRETVSRIPGIREVLVRRYQGGNGMDRYYILRGAKLVHKPACVRLQPTTKWLLKLLFPAKYSRLMGVSDFGQSSPPEAKDLQSPLPDPSRAATAQTGSPAKPS
jgi:hypothetical protein